MRIDFTSLKGPEIDALLVKDGYQTKGHVEASECVNGVLGIHTNPDMIRKRRNALVKKGRIRPYRFDRKSYGIVFLDTPDEEPERPLSTPEPIAVLEDMMINGTPNAGGGIWEPRDCGATVFANQEEALQDIKEFMARIQKHRDPRNLVPEKMLGHYDEAVRILSGRNEEVKETTRECKENGVEKLTATTLNIPLYSEQDAIDFFKIDLKKRRIVGSKFRSWPTTYTTKDKEARQQWNYYVALDTKPTEEAATIDAFEAWLKDNPALPKLPKIARKPKVGVPHLGVISVSDLHLNKLCWAEETGEDYDTNIASDRFDAAIVDLTARLSANANVGRILFIVGNDLFNVDGNSNATTAGTPQSVDDRHQRVFQRAIDLHVNAIRRMTEVAPVDVVIVPGNHDRETSFYLGSVLQAVFGPSDDVTVDNGAASRKSYRFGKVGFMLTHGDDLKEDQMPLIMATEYKEMWGQTDHHEILMGHFHKSKKMSWVDIDDFHGTVKRTMPSLTGVDLWHHSKGYGAKKGAIGLLYHPTYGYTAEEYHHPR